MKSPRLAQTGRVGRPTNLALRQSRHSIRPAAHSQECQLATYYIIRHRAHAAWIRCACAFGGASLAEPFGNHSRFQVVMRILVDSVDSLTAEATTSDASRANKARFTDPRLITLSLPCGEQKRGIESLRPLQRKLSVLC